MNLTWLYVLAVYALAVLVTRRFGAKLPWRVAALFYALVLMFFFKPMTQAFVNIPVDFVHLLPPWAFLTRHPHSYNGELNDLALQIVPWAHQVRESWRSLDVPLWNARSGSVKPRWQRSRATTGAMSRAAASDADAASSHGSDSHLGATTGIRFARACRW